MRIFSLALAGLSVAALVGCGNSNSTNQTMAEPEQGTIVEVAAAAGSFNTLLQAATAADLVDTLNSEGPFTVFAPTDEAFAKLPEGTIDELLANPEALRNILLYHVVAGQFEAEEVLGTESFDMANGGSTQISLREGAPFINDSGIIATDVMASNGVIHVIDTVLIPTSQDATAAEPVDIVETARAAGSFNTLIAALEATNLVDTLKSDGPFTVFAPTDEAFAKLPEGVLEGLLEDTEALSNILLYHVAPGALTAAEVLQQDALDMANGDTAKISTDCDVKAFIDNAQIVATDVMASNGIIHVIDAVIVPAN